MIAAQLCSLLFAVALNANVANVVRNTDAIVGVAAIDLDTGRTFTIRPDEPFPMASVFKFPLAVEVLHRVDEGKLRLDHQYTITPRDFSLGHSPIRDRAKGAAVTLTLRDLVIAAVSDSDNTAGDYLLRIVTPAAVTKRMQSLHANGIRVDRTEKEIIETFGSPEGVLRYSTDPRDTAIPMGLTALLGAFYRKHEGLSSASHELLTKIMTESNNPLRIGKLLPAGCRIAHKTGTMPGTMNDAALITSPDGRHHIAMTILTKGAKTSTEAAREELIAQIARTIYQDFVSGRPKLRQ